MAVDQIDFQVLNYFTDPRRKRQGQGKIFNGGGVYRRKAEYPLLFFLPSIRRCKNVNIVPKLLKLMPE
jgi:hypothetical protein